MPPLLHMPSWCALSICRHGVHMEQHTLLSLSIAVLIELPHVYTIEIYIHIRKTHVHTGKPEMTMKFYKNAKTLTLRMLQA
jgi:hypothetical protein